MMDFLDTPMYSEHLDLYCFSVNLLFSTISMTLLGMDGDNNGITRQSLNRLSDRTSLSLTTIKECLKSLENRNLLKTIRN